MKNKIEELAETAKIIVADKILHLERIHNRVIDLDECDALFNQQFADLIINQCAKIQEERSVERHGYDKYYDAEHIKEYFQTK